MHWEHTYKEHNDLQNFSFDITAGKFLIFFFLSRKQFLITFSPKGLLGVSSSILEEDSLTKLKPCEFLGTLCNDDCTGLVACTVIGENPLELKKCNIEVDGYAYCRQVNPTLSTCSAQQPESNNNDDSVGLICGSFGEFPHPQECDITVRCKEENKPPAELCHCPLGYFINMYKPSLPCEANYTLCNERTIVNCTYAGQNGRYPGSTDFCYACGDGENTDTLLYHCETTRSNGFDWFSMTDAADPKAAKTCTNHTT